MKKNFLYIIPAMVIFASCGGDASVDTTTLNAKVDALVKNSTDQLKTNCDAMIAQTSQMRADSIKAIKNAHIAAPKPAVAPVAAVANATHKVAAEPAHKAPVHKTPEHKAPKVVVKHEGSNPTSVNDRGNNSSAGPKSVNDRGGDTKTPTTSGPKSVNDR